MYQAAPRLLRQYTNELKRSVADPKHVPQPLRWADKGLFAAWLGHSTTLLKIDGFTILTDPVFSVRAGIHLGPITLGVKRLVAPALRLDELPPIDLVLLSHAHMDHFDIPSLRRLESPETSVVTARRTSDLLHVGQFRSVQEAGWGEEVRVGPATIRAIEVNHWGARFRTDTYRGYNGYIIEIGAYRVLFGGDTADTDKFRGIGRSGIHLAILPIGAYDPWTRFHCTPEQAWRMAGEANADLFLPVHHQTFLLSREPVIEPMERLCAAAGSGSDRIVLREIGQEFSLT
ncbi:MAG: MBL fold metallo-hydrolase [Bryobacteraceae bacterium]|nr:MBL fold metallo-hydrolase [Bryobacteraceae bacterium]